MYLKHAHNYKHTQTEASVNVFIFVLFVSMQMLEMLLNIGLQQKSQYNSLVLMKIKRTLFNTNTHTASIFMPVFPRSTLWTVFHLESIIDGSVTLNLVMTNIIFWIIHLLLKSCFWQSTLTAWIRVNCHWRCEQKTATRKTVVVSSYSYP